MNYFYDIVFTAVLMTVLLATSSATGKSFVLSPQSKHTVMQIREFHECVSCHENNQIRKDYNKCLQLLSQQNRKLIKDCCVPTFNKKFCNRNFIGDAQFSTICTNPNKAFEVGRCFWKKTSNKNSSDIETYRNCKRRILSQYCTSSS